MAPRAGTRCRTQPGRRARRPRPAGRDGFGRRRSRSRPSRDRPDRAGDSRPRVRRKRGRTGKQHGRRGLVRDALDDPDLRRSCAVSARSTTAVFPPTDYRFLLVQARGVSDVTDAAVARDPTQPAVAPVRARSTKRERERTTIVTLDLGYARVPIDRLSIGSRTPRYVRAVSVEGSNDGTTFIPLSNGEIARFPGVDLSKFALGSRHRLLRVTIRNGDDAPLERLRVTAEAMPRPLLLASGFKAPFRLLYGDATLAAPSYDFARLPAAATGFENAREGTLGAERANELFEAPGDTRTFFERNDYDRGSARGGDDRRRGCRRGRAPAPHESFRGLARRFRASPCGRGDPGSLRRRSHLALRSCRPSSGSARSGRS